MDQFSRFLEKYLNDPAFESRINDLIERVEFDQVTPKLLNSNYF